MDKPSYYELYVKEVENEDVKVFLCVKVSTIDNITYFQVSHLQAEEVTKVLMNNTPYKMSVRSKTWKHEPIQQIEPQTKIYYAQNYPNKAGSVILVHFYNSEKQMITIEIDFLIITTAPRHFDCGEADKMVQVSVRFIGSNKVIEILLISREQLIHQTQNRPDEVITIKYSYNIIDLSFMQLPRKSPRRELANVFLYNTYGLIEVKNMTNITLKGCVEHFQIDNNSNQNTSFPVVLRRVNEKLRKNIPNKKFLEWNIAFENPSRSTHLYVSNLAVNLGNLELMLEEEYLDQVMVYFSEIAGRIQREKAHTHFDFIQRKYFDQIDIDDGFDFNKKVWEFTQIDKKNNYVYIDNMCLPKIWCLLSYYQDASSTIDKDFALVSLLGVAVGGFESASIEIKGLHKDNMYQPVDILFEDLARYYKAQLLKVGYAILGSLNILGNPSQIIREFRGDIDNVLDSHGDDSAKVIAEGAGVIAKNTMAGGINNTTGSFAGVMSLMTADKQFMKERGLRRRKKAKNVLQGFEQGANSLFHGITNGISGIVSQPYYEIKSQGVYGVFPGLFKGFTGIITKPLSGLLDTISKTAEGIQNTAKGRLENIQRARPPRAFYNEDMVVKEFSFDDAVYYDTMKTVDKRNDSLIIGFSNLRNKDKSVYMALTTAYISLIDEDLRTTQIHMNKITRILQTDGNSICIEYKSSNESHRITLTVEEGQFNAKNIVEEMHLQIGLIVAKT